ncbi:MAG TPA: SurA N-terminal domain-containing protein [Bacteroidales bacterium]|nr:SurA N-terminal domain-containing protein [Bacteroidales bacterium]
MAVIGKIRQRSGLLIAVIGIALAAFVLGDFAKSSSKREFHIGTIDGENISIQDFNKKFEDNAEATRQQRNLERLSQDELYSIRESTWNQLLQQIIMQKEYDQLGLVVSTEELFDLVQGPNPHPAIISNFTNPETGQYDRNLVLNYLQNLDQMQPAAKEQWIKFEQYLKEDRLSTKYQNLIHKAMHIPTPIAEMIYREKNDKADVDYVGVRYASIADSLITLTDKDYKTYFEANKKMYEREAMRDIEYVVFDILPSQQDNEEAQMALLKLIPEFTATTNVEGFVNANSDQRYDSTWFSRGKLSPAIEGVMFDSQPGFVYGPYFENGAYKASRLVDVTFKTDSVRASHILVAYEGAMRSEARRTKEAAKVRADSILAEVKKKPSKMKELAQKLSDDASAATNSGDLDWFVDGTMVKPFGDFVMNNKVGTIGLVETDFGYHIIEVTGKKEPSKRVRVATISFQVTPSTRTYQDVFAKASKFATESKTREQFDATTERDGLSKRVAPALRKSTNRLPGIDNARPIVRWAFDEKTSENDVSTIFELDDMFVVAVLTKKLEKGIPTLDEIKETIESQVRNQKKGEYLLEQFKQEGNDLDRVSAKYGVERTNQPDLTFDTRFLQNFGQENKFIGHVFGTQPGQNTAIAGANAAFVLKVNSITKSDAPTSLDQVRMEQRMGFESVVRNNGAFRALEKKAKITDNRLLFY